MTHHDQLELRTHYWNDPEAKAAFRAFILQIHGLDFTLWQTLGFWDDAYTPFSFFEENSVVSSVCIYPLDAIIDGRNTTLIQISGVGTLPHWRKQGLNRQLTDIGLAWVEGQHDGVFLFADDDAIPYYRKCGFRQIEEFLHTMKLDHVSPRKGARHLLPGNNEDLLKIHAYVKARAPVSDRFSIMNTKLVMFHVLYTLHEAIVEIPDLDCLVFCDRENGILRIYDIIAERIPGFDDLYPYLAEGSDQLVEFHFNTDQLGIDKLESRVLTGNNLFVSQDFPIQKPVFPFASRA